VVDEAE